jgi:hypothetical protein
MNTKGVRGSEMKLLVERILKRANKCENFDQVRPKKSKGTQNCHSNTRRNKKKNRSWELICNINMQLFRVQHILNRPTIL